MTNPTGQSGNEKIVEGLVCLESLENPAAAHAHCTNCDMHVPLEDFSEEKEYPNLVCPRCGSLLKLVPFQEYVARQQPPRRGRGFFQTLFRRREEQSQRRSPLGAAFGESLFVRMEDPFADDLPPHIQARVVTTPEELLAAVRESFGLPPKEDEGESVSPGERRARMHERAAARAREEETRLKEAQSASDSVSARIREAINTVVEGITLEEKRALRGTSLTIRHELIFPNIPLDSANEEDPEPSDSMATEGDDTLNSEELATDVADAVKSGDQPADEKSADCTS